MSTTVQPPQEVKTALELSFPLEQWEHLMIQQTGNKAAAEAADRLGAGAAISSAVRNRTQ